MSDLISDQPQKVNKTICKCLSTFYGIVLCVCLIPIAAVAPYVRATGDDLNYSAEVHQAILAGSGIRAVLCAVWDTVRGTWYSWQGTWSSVALFSLQPGIWGDNCYPVTIAVGLVCVLGGTWYFLHVLGRMRRIGAGTRWGICFLTGILMIQYMPNMKCGIFWWTSVAHYCIPYGIALMCMGWSLRWLKTRQKRFMCGMLSAMAYLGGAGYPEVVLAAVWFFFVPFIVMAYRHLAIDAALDKKGQSVKHVFGMWVPLLLEMAGFAISAVAPGNKNRGGEDFGFSVTKVVWTLAACVREGIVETVKYCIKVRVLLPILMLIALILLIHCGGIKPREITANWKEWGIIGGFGFVEICLVRAPVLYAGTDASGGVPDSYWFITIVAVVAWLEILLSPKNASTECAEDASRSLTEIYAAMTAGMIAFLFVFSRHFVSGSVDYTCVQFIRSGALADYHEQMEEWLDILSDPTIANAELPSMNSEQGPFMLMVPLDDPEAWSSQVYARYFGKNSVICVPRS